MRKPKAPLDCVRPGGGAQHRGRGFRLQAPKSKRAHFGPVLTLAETGSKSRLRFRESEAIGRAAPTYCENAFTPFSSIQPLEAWLPSFWARILI